jgi:hypothetical protein
MAAEGICDKLAAGNPLHIKVQSRHREVGVKFCKTLLSLFFCLVALSVLVTAAMADTVRLRDGTVLKGKVVSYGQGKFTVLVYIGGKPSQHVLSVEEIESVEFDGADAMTGGAITNRSGVSAPSTDIPRDATILPADKPLADNRDAAIAAPVSGAGSISSNDSETGVIATIAEKTVSVAAGADWTSSEIRVQRGQRIVISAIGEVDLGDNHRTGPDGLSLADKDKLMADQPTGALIAVIGDDNNDFIVVGQSTEFVAKHNGILFLSVNEGNLKDNNGAFVARVKVLSNR